MISATLRLCNKLFLLKNICNIGLYDEKISMMPSASDNILLIVEQEGWGGEKKTMALL